MKLVVPTFGQAWGVGVMVESAWGDRRVSGRFASGTGEGSTGPQDDRDVGE